MFFRRSSMAGAALLIATATSALSGVLAGHASAATFFRTIDSSTDQLQLSATSSTSGSSLKFVPRFKGVAPCATCGVADTPSNLAWAQVKFASSASAVSLVNKQTQKCADVELSAQAPGAKLAGARIVLAPCDGTLSQQWKVLFASGGNQSTFQNQLDQVNRFVLTNAQSNAILEPITINNNLSASERLKHIQRFGSTLVNAQ
jgi:hypothetical protein